MTTTTRPTFATKNDLDPTIRADLVQVLNRQLAANADLYAQTKQAHWNVKGMDFMQLHLLFDQIAEVVEPQTDEIAERIAALGGYAEGTIRMTADASPLPEWPREVVDGRGTLEALIERWAAYAAMTRKAIESASEQGDAATEGLLTDIVTEVDKALYFLEAHCKANRTQRNLAPPTARPFRVGGASLGMPRAALGLLLRTHHGAHERAEFLQAGRENLVHEPMGRFEVVLHEKVVKPVDVSPQGCLFLRDQAARLQAIGHVPILIDANRVMDGHDLCTQIMERK